MQHSAQGVQEYPRLMRTAAHAVLWVPPWLSLPCLQPLTEIKGHFCTRLLLLKLAQPIAVCCAGVCQGHCAAVLLQQEGKERVTQLHLHTRVVVPVQAGDEAAVVPGGAPARA
eukprot:scaffold147949_cov24-Tisochrysis_lutea.AAC.1